jgi:primary-amine oxidase
MSILKAYQCQNKFHEAIVDLTKGRALKNVLLGQFVHANGDGEEIIEIERVVLADEGVKAAIAKLQLPEGTVVISDPWIYGMLTCITSSSSN